MRPEVSIIGTLNPSALARESLPEPPEPLRQGNLVWAEVPDPRGNTKSVYKKCFPRKNQTVRWLERESFLAPIVAGILSRIGLEPVGCRMGILPRVGTR